jgi:hypothetical protein
VRRFLSRNEMRARGGGGGRWEQRKKGERVRDRWEDIAGRAEDEEGRGGGW